MPSVVAVATSLSDVAFVILSLAVLAALLASSIKLAFSSAVILVALLISLILLVKASSIALIASSLVADVVGTLIALIFSIPAFFAS